LIVNRTYEVPAEPASGSLLGSLSAKFTGEMLRWFISSAGPEGYQIDATECTTVAPPAFDTFALATPSGMSAVISLIPTGIGCATGGYAGDAAPATALLASAADLVVTNPNALNASNFIAADRRIIYTEGFSLDLFAAGRASLFVPNANVIGVIIEKAGDEEIARVLNLLNTVRAVYGINIVDYIVTDQEIGVRCRSHDSGAYTGNIDRPDVLLDAGRQLLSAGATALAITTNVRDLPAEAYARHFSGSHPNPVGGAEAIVSHLITRTLGVPAAHAPMINFKHVPAEYSVVDARSAAEFSSTSGLACVLIGLRKAPQLQARSSCGTAMTVSIDDVLAVVAPATALGSIPVLAAAERRTPIVAVAANTTILNVTASRLGLPGVIEVDNYLEAAGAVLALRTGVSVESIRRPLLTLGAGEKLER
jgi:Protein of unknown function (DUF3326)